MLRKVLKKIRKQFQKKEDVLLLQSKEIEWAHNYHDSIRGITYIENLNLNIGRWAGNYAFFYVLNRILNDYKPKHILELGLGESSKFISKYIEFSLKDTNHTIVEQSSEWEEAFSSRFQLSKNSQIKICQLTTINVKGFQVNSYEKVDEVVGSSYDLYLVDGPFGSVNYSRYDIVTIAKNIKNTDEFIILMDDYNRKGEQQTTEDLLALFKQKGIKIYKSVYVGNKSVAVLATEKYKYSTSF